MRALSTTDAERWVDSCMQKERAARDAILRAKRELLEHMQRDYDKEAAMLKKEMKYGRAIGVGFSDLNDAYADRIMRAGKALEAAHRLKDPSDQKTITAFNRALDDARELGMSVAHVADADRQAGRHTEHAARAGMGAGPSTVTSTHTPQPQPAWSKKSAAVVPLAQEPSAGERWSRERVGSPH